MRIVFLGNNLAALWVVEWLKTRGEHLAALVVHPPERQKLGAEIISAAGLPKEAVFQADELAREDVLARLRQLQPEVGVSVFFGYILKPPFLKLLPRGCVNLHPALLPYNRGAHPNVWSIVEGTPAGATLHLVDEGVDTGAILAQRELPVEPVDTGETIYRRLEQVCVDLFQQAWPEFVAGKLTPQPQPREADTSHRVRDLERISEIDLNRSYRASDLINLLRARTFPPHRGAYFVAGGRKVFLELKLSYDDATPPAAHG